MNLSTGLSLTNTLDQRNSCEIVPIYDKPLVDQIVAQCHQLFEDNQQTIKKKESKEYNMKQAEAELQARHVTLNHNRRCLLAYHHERCERLKKLPWELGSVPPPEVDLCLSDGERRWLSKYSDNLVDYMQNLFDGRGFDVTRFRKAPRKLLIQVKCLQDHGKYELEDGTVVVLSKNTIHTMPLRDAEHLIHRGVLVEIPF